MVKVGVPRAMLYHQYGESWVSFLDELGIEPVVTAATTSDTVRTGTMYADNESCLPVKVFAGHLVELRDAVDAIIVPRVISQHPGMKACPKYLGLPDMARALDRDLPPVLAPAIDLSDRRHRWTSDWYDLARDYGTPRTDAAAAVGRLLGRVRKPVFSEVAISGAPLRVGVAGHLYNLHDQGASSDLVNRIQSMGADVVMVEQVPKHLVRRQLRTLPRKIKWDFESAIVGAAMHWDRTRAVSGIIYISSFACGPGSMIGALLDDQHEREGNVPLMTITLDEHSAEGGLVTRIEAFLDMLRHNASIVRFARRGPSR
ncbi:MAG: acyl-CoA dehydratase activase-related protein, partial [Candidatus Geothermincolia bacterium]